MPAFFRYSWQRLGAYALAALLICQPMSVSLVLAQELTPFLPADVTDLNRQINSRTQSIKELQDQAQTYNRIIAQKEAQKETLQNELAILENRVKKAELDIQGKNLEIDKTNLTIRQTQLQIDGKAAQIDIQKTQLSSLLRDIHREDQRGRLEILLANNNISKFFGYLKQLEDVQSNLRVTLSGVESTKRDLEVYQFGLEQDNAQLQTLALELEIEKQKLDETRQSKLDLIDETDSSERNFQDKLAEIRYQQRQANDEIAQLQQTITRRLRQAQQDNPSFILNPGELIWPIPNQGIVTYFHDPTYPFRNIVGEHSGLDMRTLVNGYPGSGLPVHAAASGVVAKIIRNGRYTGNAVFIAHGDLMSIYLHLVEIDVQNDQFVDVGQMIGRSGGQPGLPSSGLSSGPHLHFEVRKDGIPVDPCQYLSPGC